MATEDSMESAGTRDRLLPMPTAAASEPKTPNLVQTRGLEVTGAALWPSIASPQGATDAELSDQHSVLRAPLESAGGPLLG